MIQKKYTFHTLDELKDIVYEITEDDNYKTASGVLLQMYNPKVDADEEAFVEYINAHCIRGILIGITCANIADEKYDIKDNPVELNVTYFQKTKLIEMDFDMHDATGFVAGRIINEQLQFIPNAKCMQICYSCNSLVIHSFVNEFRHHNLPMFGAKAGRSIRVLNSDNVYGKRVNNNGIVVVIFQSESLGLYMDNCLGFKEIGLEMMVTKTEGDNVISMIDNKPAIDIYSKYLKVRPNKFFVQNVCEFPLIFHRNDCIIARIPSGYGEDGSIRLISDVAKGETFRLSYGNEDNLSNVINKSIKGIQDFKPEALFLFQCGNRARFLKEKASNDTNPYIEICPEASVAIGYAELFYTESGTGGALNSALVAVGLTENGPQSNVIRPCLNYIDETDELDDRDYIPFVERILYFLETTSLELDAMNKELGKIAYTDQLTKIYNRWELENKLEETLKTSEINNTPSCLIFMDI
ncbi:MAG: FIST C-terminal domain-containing protein, partial [Butyrivibrio sp.]|nr:FIST C-terminal domain-containing protein [Butyrivibrio sp.]